MSKLATSSSSRKPVAIPEADLENSRKGVVYLFANIELETSYSSAVIEGGLKIVGGSLGGDAGDIFERVEIPASKMLEMGDDAFHQASGGTQGTLMTRVKAWAKDFCKKLWDVIKERFTKVELLLSDLESIAAKVAKVIIKSLVPFASQALDLVQGLANLGDATVKKVKAWYAGRNVHVIAGHPDLAIQAIRRAMNLSLFEGLYQTLKGGAALGATVASYGAAHIVSIFVSVAEAVTRMIYRLCEISIMRHFFEEAAVEWKNREAANAIFKDVTRFSEWYGDAALKTPPVAVLTLISGICGDKMRWLRMFDGTSVITQKEFKKGVNFIDGLKSYGAQYLQEANFKFSSRDALVGSLINYSRILEQQSAPKSSGIT